MAKTGIFPTAEPPEPRLNDFVNPRQEFFVDGREGVDRWGRDRTKVLACGTGWDDYVCPAYVEESCPGNRGPGLRSEGDRTMKCDLKCGQCGGGGRTETMAYCGWTRAAGPFKAAMGEMGGSLKLDRYKCAPAPALERWGVPFMPAVEWGAKAWQDDLTRWNDGQPYEWMATSLRTASPGQTRDGQGLRERLGKYGGKIVVHGLAKDDVLDDIWDRRERVLKWLLAEDPDVMVTPQFSYYSDDQNCMALYNFNRIFRWYTECRDMGFRNVGLDWPPWNVEWARDEFLQFALRNEVKLICPSYQTMGSRGGLISHYLYELRRLHKELPLDVSFLIFGQTNVTAFTQTAMSLPGRNVCFTTSDAFARAAFFRLIGGGLAPKRFTKGDTFAWNVMHYKKLTARAVSVGDRRAARLAEQKARAAA